MVLKLKRNNIQKKKKKKYSFTIAKKIDHTLLKISYLFCYVFAAKLAVAIPQMLPLLGFLSALSIITIIILIHNDRNSDEMGDCHSTSSCKKHFYNMDGVIRKYRNLIIRMYFTNFLLIVRIFVQSILQLS